MSAPGAPPETDVPLTEDEFGPERRPPPPDPFASLSQTGGSDQIPLTTDERFAPGTPPNMAGQLTPPDDVTSGRFATPAPRGPMVGPPDVQAAPQPNPDEVQIGPQGPLPAVKPRSNLFSPVPIEEQIPRMGQTGRIRKDVAFDPESVGEQSFPLKNMAPRKGPVDDNRAQAQPETNPDSTLGRAVDRATGMVGMHERVNQRDIQKYLADGGADMNPAKTAWCAAFVNASLKMAGLGGSGSQVATSFMNKGQPVTTEPQKGDVVVESRGKRPGQTGGHVGLATGRTRQNAQGGYEFEVVSGNLSNRVGKEWVPAQTATVRRMGRSGPAGAMPVPTQAVKGVPTTTISGAVAAPTQQQFVPVKPDDEAVDVAVKTPTATAPAPVSEAPQVHPQTGKPVIQNADGTISTERTITITDVNGQYVNIPTVINGRQLSNESAAKAYQRGKNPPVGGPFTTLEQAVTSAKERSASLAVPEVTDAPVVAPAGTPVDELNRLSQTKPWLIPERTSRQGPRMPITSVVPSEMGGVAPLTQPQPEQLLSEDDAYKALEPTFEEPLYVKKEIPFEYEYRNPSPDVVEIEPMPIAETSPLPLPPLPPEDAPLITRGPHSSTYQPIASPQRFVYTSVKPAVPDGVMALDDEGLPAISKLMRDKVAAVIGEENLATADEKVRGIKWMGQGFTSSVGQFMYMIPAMNAAAQALPYAVTTGKVHPYDQKRVEWWVNRMHEVETGTRKLWGLGATEQPQNLGERINQLTGESITPAGRLTLPLTVLNLGVRAYIDPNVSAALSPISEAEAAPRKTAAEKKAEQAANFDPATGMPIKDVPGQLEPGNVHAGALKGPVFGTPFPQPDGSIVLVPNASIRGDRNLTGDEAIAQYGRTGLNYGMYDSIESAHKYLEILNSRVTQTAQTAAGPAELKVSDLALMTAMGAATVGMAFGPKLYNTFRYGKLPVGPSNLTANQGRVVENAAPGTLAFTTHKDFLRTTVDDFHAAQKSLLARSGASPDTLAKFDVVYANTRGGATNIAQSATTTGRAASPEFNFQVKNARPLAELNKADAPDVREYFAMLNTFEEIVQTNKQTIASQGPVPAGVKPTAPNPGPVTIRGHTEQTAAQEITRLETSNPTLRPLAQEVRNNNRELLRVESTGRWATRTKADARDMAVTRQFYVDYGKNNPVEVSPFGANITHTNERLRLRLDNAANGQFIEHMNTVRPGMFVETTAAQLKQYPHWEPNSVKVYDYGKPRYYTTDPLLASTMKIDPHFYQSSVGANSVIRWLSAPKRVMEVGTTRFLAPWFAPVNAARNHLIVRTAAPGAGLQAPKALQTMAEIHRDLIPQITNGLAKSFDTTGLIGRTLGQRAPAWMDALGKRWANTYIDSNHARIQQHGGNYGSAYDHKITTDRIIGQAMQGAQGNAKQFLAAWQNFLGSTHGAATNAAVRKNWYRTELPQTDPNFMSRSDLVTRARRLTGDPVVQGEMFGAGPIRFHAQGPVAKIGAAGVYGVGATAELARVMVPWFNTTVQGIKGVGRSYAANPAKFTAALWSTQLLPAMVAFAWNKSLGRDSQGVSFSDHQMNGRTPYNSLMSLYLGIPGRPASAGIELPIRFHEVSIFSRWFEIALDHMFNDPRHTALEDWQYMTKSWLGLAADVPYPTLANMVLAHSGMTPKQGIFEGEAYKRREFPYDQNAGLPVNFELMARAMGGGVTDILASGATALIQEENMYKKPGAFLSQAGSKVIERTPLLRNVFDMAPPIAGNTRAAEEMFEYRNVLRKLDEFYRNYGQGGGRKVSSKPASGPGGQIVRGQLGPATPEIAPGLPQPQTTNPLYNKYMAMVHDRITKDVPEKGGMGYKSAMQEYFKTSKELSTLKNITTSSYSTWQQWMNMEKNKELKDFLEKNNVDTTRPTAVINFYQGRRQAAMQLMLKMFKSVEYDISQQIGRPFKVKELDPYIKLGDLPKMVPRNDVMDLMQGEYFSGTQAPGAQ